MHGSVVIAPPMVGLLRQLVPDTLLTQQPQKFSFSFHKNRKKQENLHSSFVHISAHVYQIKNLSVLIMLSKVSQMMSFMSVCVSDLLNMEDDLLVILSSSSGLKPVISSIYL